MPFLLKAFGFKSTRETFVVKEGSFLFNESYQMFDTCFVQ